MDGHDFHAVGHVEYLREQAARPGMDLGAGRPAGELGQRFGERRLFGDRPTAQLIIDSPGHFRRRRFGESKAEDTLGRNAGQQQAEHPVGQDLRLARARRRRHPGAGARICRPALVDLGQPVELFRDSGDVHASSPPPAPAADHSLTRARCS